MWSRSAAARLSWAAGNVAIATADRAAASGRELCDVLCYV